MRETGDRFTGGGLRSLARRVLANFVQRSMAKSDRNGCGQNYVKAFPKGSSDAYNLATERDAVSASSIPPAVGPLTSEDPATAVALPASAQSIYLKLKSAMSDSDALEAEHNENRVRPSGRTE